METIDPSTGLPLPADAIQRVLFVSHPVHVYNIPPLPSTKGHNAASWTADPERHIFLARCRAVETSYDDPEPSFSSSSSSAPLPPSLSVPSSTPSLANRLKVDVVLEDPTSGRLFAAAPYVSPAAVEPVVDSSRFFALTVRDPEGRKAMLGIGFEDRSEAFDFSVALQEARRGLGWEIAGGGSGSSSSKGGDGNSGKSGGGGMLQGNVIGGSGLGKGGAEEEKRDYSLKEGETITINLGGTRFGQRRRSAEARGDDEGGSLAGLSLPPPPPPPPGGSGSGFPLPPPPPPATDRRHKRTSQSAEELGFDNGKDGEFA